MKTSLTRTTAISVLAMLLALIAFPAMAQGNPLAYNTVVTGNLSADAPTAAYTFSGTQGDTITAYVVGLTPDMLPRLSLTPSGGESLPDALHPARNRGELTYTLPETADYTLTVSGTGAAFGDFVLGLEATSANTIVPLNVGQPNDLNLLPGAGPITLRLTLDAEQLTILRLTPVQTDLSFTAEVRNASGALVAQLDRGVAGAALALWDGTADSYTLIVTAANPDAQGVLTVQMDRDTAAPAESAPAPTAAPAATVPPAADGPCEDVALFMSDVTIPDGTLIEPGAEFVKTWQLRNTGTCAWNEDYTLAQIAGEGLTITNAEALTLPDVQPGEDVNISVAFLLDAATPLGETRSATFEMRSPREGGYVFGPQPYVEVVAGVPENSQAATSGDCVDDAEYVADVTIPDGTTVRPGEPFVKTWQLRNTGTCTWDTTYSLRQLTGDSLLANEQITPLAAAVAPNETVDVSVTLTLAADTPLAEARTAGFRLQNAGGGLFGEEVYAQVIAGE
jgi:hypothetical protein